MTKALGLFSGGLDSILAALVLRRQGIEVAGVTFVTPFFGAEKALKSAAPLAIPLIVRDIGAVHLEMLKNPRYGYGRNLNPCIDCHALMFRLAAAMMADGGFDFLFSGEVLGQRPMSQNLNSLKAVAKASGAGDRILRPLSARLLPVTAMEKEGRVDRNQLLDIQGRSRRRQEELANEWGVKVYPAPGGGCLLVGAPAQASGSAFLFNDQTESGGGWVLIERFTRPADSAAMTFGRAVGFQQGTAIVGAPAYQAGDKGFAFIYRIDYLTFDGLVPAALAPRASGRLATLALCGLLLGVLFAVAFCPTSAIWFFGLLALILGSEAGGAAIVGKLAAIGVSLPEAALPGAVVVLPLVYVIGTAVPVLLVAFLLAYSAQAVGKTYNALSKIEWWARQITGWVFLVVGVIFTLRYVFETV